MKKRSPRGPNSKVIGVTRLLGDDQAVTVREFPDGRAKVIVSGRRHIIGIWHAADGFEVELSEVKPEEPSS